MFIVADLVSLMFYFSTMSGMKENKDIACYHTTKHSWKGKWVLESGRPKAK